MSVAELCRDRTYPTRHVTSLPRTCGPLLIDYARVDELSVCRQMVHQAAQRGDNVGLDQFTKEKDFAALLEPSEIFVGKKPGSTSPSAFIVIQPCKFARVWGSRWASIHVFYTDDLERTDKAASDVTQTVYSQLLRLAVDFTHSIDLGYADCLVCLASCCTLRLNATRQQGFVIIATIPNSVDITCFGLQDDFWLVKSLSDVDRPRRPPEMILEMVEKAFPSDESDAAYRDADLPHVKFLPQEYVFLNGLTVTVRMMYKHEDSLVYGMLKATAEKGEGFGEDEFPTLSAFRSLILMTRYCFIFEEVATGKLVGFTIIADSYAVRSRKSRTFNTITFIAPEFQGRRIGREVIGIELSLAVELGYVAMVNDWLASNRRMETIQRTMFGTRVLIIGVLPRSTYTANVGWDNHVNVWHDVRATGIRPFTEIAELSRMRPKQCTVSKL